MRRLEGKVVIITGASRGIGAAAAKAIAAEGAALMLAARTGRDLSAVASELAPAGTPVEAMACDVADFAQVQAAADRTRQVFGRIDALINNAGVIEPIGPLASSDPAAWAHAAAINFTGVYNGMRAVLPAMRSQGSGAVWLAKSIWLTGLMPDALIWRCMSVATVPGDSEKTRTPRPRFSR